MLNLLSRLILNIPLSHINSYAVLKFSRPNTFRILKTYQKFGFHNDSWKPVYIVHKSKNTPRQIFIPIYNWLQNSPWKSVVNLRSHLIILTWFAKALCSFWNCSENKIEHLWSLLQETSFEILRSFLEIFFCNRRKLLTHFLPLLLFKIRESVTPIKRFGFFSSGDSLSQLLWWWSPSWTI